MGVFIELLGGCGHRAVRWVWSLGIIMCRNSNTVQGVFTQKQWNISRDQCYHLIPPSSPGMEAMPYAETWLQILFTILQPPEMPGTMVNAGTSTTVGMEYFTYTTSPSRLAHHSQF